MEARWNSTVKDAATGQVDGFTRVDLLMIIGLVALLATIQVSAHVGSEGRTKVAMCASNVRQLTLAVHLYAGENNNKLPVLSGAAAWAWDLPWNAGEALYSYNPHVRDFYCPGTAPRFNDEDNSSLWNWSPGVVHVAGYVFAFSGSSSLLVATNQNTTILAEPIKLGPFAISPLQPPKPNSERVLVADATLCLQQRGNYALRYTYNYTDIVGGFGKPHTSPHLRGRFPDGGNLGFKDGHVAWRKFDDMSPRTVSGPTFWW